MCIGINELKYIKQVKDSSPFTCDQSLLEYINGVKDRIAKWYGIDRVEISLELVYKVLKCLEHNKPTEK